LHLNYFSTVCLYSQILCSRICIVFVAWRLFCKLVFESQWCKDSETIVENIYIAISPYPEKQILKGKDSMEYL